MHLKNLLIALISKFRAFHKTHPVWAWLRSTSEGIARASYSTSSIIVKALAMVKYCVAAGCKSTSNDGISFFKFPSNPSLRQQWTRQVERTRDRWSGPSKHSVLCATHFTQDCFEADSAIAATMGLNKRRRLREGGDDQSKVAFIRKPHPQCSHWP